MVCLRCQRFINKQAERCPTCGFLLQPPAPRTDLPIASKSASARSAHASEAVATRAAFSRPTHSARGAEGQIVAVNTSHPDEPRDVDTLAAFLAAVVMLEIGLLLLLLAAQLFVALVVLIVLLSLLGLGAGRSLGCLTSLARLPMQLLGWIWRPARETFQPELNPLNNRPVHSYQISLASRGEIECFVKGVLSPQSPQPGDQVRVSTRRQGRRLYCESFFLLDPGTGSWRRLTISERSTWGLWLVAALGLGVLIVVLLARLSGG